MKVLVFPHKLTRGGSQLVALDLAAAVRDRGHEVVVYGYDGPLADTVARHGLRFVAAPAPRDARAGEDHGALWPSWRTMRDLRRVARRERVDLVHAYEWYPALEAFWSTQLRDRIPTVTTVLSMSVPWFLPRTGPLLVGTADLADAMRRRHRGDVVLAEPAVDTDRDRPGCAGPDGTVPADPTGRAMLVIVSRLAAWKLDGIHAAIDAVESLAPARDIRLVIAGDGAGRPELERRADEVNRAVGAGTIALVGEVDDPRCLYAAADVVLGMGSSVLRGLAFGKPSIVLGEDGFSETVTPETVDAFLQQGFFGSGADDVTLASRIDELVGDRALAARLGSYGRVLVCRRFDLDRAAAHIEATYERAVAAPTTPARTAIESARTALLLVRVKAVSWVRRLSARATPTG
jgi:glycosyltransferase involved in cell wall biosynthesis